MRVWDRICPSKLCRQHLLAEHNEIHVIYRTITEGRKGWANHPEVNRWRGHVGALVRRHDQLVAEFGQRNWPSGKAHKTHLIPAMDSYDLPDPLPGKSQVGILGGKGCECRVGLRAARERLAADHDSAVE